MPNEGDVAAAKSSLGKRTLLALIVAVLVVIASPPVSANYASLVMDASNGRVLYEANADLPRYPASLTKIMSLYLLFEALDHGTLTLNQPMPVSEHAAAQPPTKLGLRPGQWLRVEDAILGLVTKSANDAAAVVAEGLAGSESRFAWMMTAKAHALGMSQTTFANASGLPDPDQVTTARDIAILALALLHDFPHYYHYFSTHRFYYGGAVYPNHNRMLGDYPGLDGIKTGYTYASGFNLVASAQRDGRRIIGVVMGARSPGTRNVIMANLLDQAFAGDDIIIANHGALPQPVFAASVATTGTTLSTRSGKRFAAGRSTAVKVAARTRLSRFASKAASKVAAKAATRAVAPKLLAARKGAATVRPAATTRIAAAKTGSNNRLASATAKKPKIVVATAAPSKPGVQSKAGKSAKSASSAAKRRVADAGRRPSS